MGVSVIAEDQNGDTPLGMMLANKRMVLVDVMVRFNSAEATDCNIRGNTILHIFLEEYRHDKNEGYNKMFLNVIDTSIFKGANLNQPNNNGLTPVHLTVKPFHDCLMEKFIRLGADLHRRTNSGGDLLMLACKHAHPNRIDWLLKQGSNVNTKNNYGSTPLHVATQRGTLSLVKILAAAGADVHAVTSEGTSALHMATTNLRFDVVLYFIELGVKFDRRNILHGFQLMYWLLLVPKYTKDRDAFQWLIKRGFDRSEKGEPSLMHLAAIYGYVEIVKILIERGANVDCQDNHYRYAPLHLASMRREFATVPELCQVGLIGGKVDVDSASFKTNTTTFRTSLGKDRYRIDYESTVLVLLKAGADINAKDRRGRTPLHYAARHENDLIVLLLQAGARVYDVDLEGLSPLHNSLLSGNVRTMKYLLTFGADINDVEHLRRDIFDEIKELNTSSSVKSHLAKLKVAGLTVSHLHRPNLYHKKYHDHYIEYSDELEEMKNRMSTSQVSLYDWLRMNWKRRLVHIDDWTASVKDEFQHYGIIILGLCHEAVNRNQLMGPSRIALQLLTGWQWPDLCAGLVLSYLNNRILSLLIAAAKD